jgi:F0F1-type ATP synthase membrane subunit a
MSHCARLTINTTLGHLYLKLSSAFVIWSIANPSRSKILTLFLLILTTFLIFFEILIAILQSYIFCFLLTIYITDHPRMQLPYQDKAYPHLLKSKFLTS